MSHIGNIPFNSEFNTDRFTGNGTQTSFTLTRSAINNSSIIVTINGAKISPIDYVVTNTILTFNIAPGNSSKIEIIFLSLVGSTIQSGTVSIDTVKIADKSITQAKLTILTKQTLTSNLTYYVRTDGSNSNDGLTNNSGGAFASIQAAVDAALLLDARAYTVFIQVGNGTYYGSTIINKPLTGSNRFAIIGDVTNPNNVVLTSNTVGHTILVTSRSAVTLRGLRLQNAHGGSLVICNGNSVVNIDQKMHFGYTTGDHLLADTNSIINVTTAYSIVGGANTHYKTVSGGLLNSTDNAVSIIGATPNFTQSFTLADSGYVVTPNTTFSGSATGYRYYVQGNGAIQTYSANPNFFPGNSAGNVGPGGYYG